MKDIMVFKDSEGHPLEINSWYKIPPNRSNFYRFKEYKNESAIFEVFGFDGYTTIYSFIEEQIARADKINDINDFLERKRKQISAIEKALAQSQPKCTGTLEQKDEGPTRSHPLKWWFYSSKKI